MKVEKLQSAKGRYQSAVYLVKDGGIVVGMLEKYRNTRTETHPWKAFLGTGLTARFLGAFYNADQLTDGRYDSLADGVVADNYPASGKQAAIQAIADARHATSGKVPAGIDFDTP